MILKSGFILILLNVLLIIPSNCEQISHHRIKRIVGGKPADYPPFDDPVVYTRFNGRSARVIGSREFPHYVFKGIKYAHPPIGADRFLRPREKFLEGEINATVFSPPCIQPIPGKNFILGTEDCLALNIFTPDLPSGTEGLPVIIWIHGGGFRYGSASQYGVRHLVSQRLLVVTIQYRLGSLGFLSSGDKNLPGNAALWDMALAVQWVRNYIGFFGGNPYRIVVMGHDTGASSALLLTLTKIAKGIPNAVVAMSGTAVSRWAIDNTPGNTAKEIAEQNGCPISNVVTMVKCLQKIPAESIVRGDSDIEFQKLQNRGFVSGLNGRLSAAPVAEGRNDGRSLPGLVEVDPVEQLYKQDNPRIPLLTGVTKDETKKAVNGHYKQDIVKQLTTIPNFLNKELLGRLQNSSVLNRLTQVADNLGKNLKIGNFSLGNVGNLDALGHILPLNFDNYLKVKSNDLREGLNKVADVTADALFNVPAFLTAQFWKGAPTFLYSFEHSGKLHKGNSFLQGLPLIGNSSQVQADASSNVVAHGDELAYIFEAHDLEGKPLPANTPTEDDLKVRKVFLQMITDFARHGEIRLDNKKVPSFSAGENNFVQIKPTPVLANKFKFCEMALWTNIAERLKSSYCQVLDAFGKVPYLPQSLDKIGEVIPPGLGNILPGGAAVQNGGASRPQANNNPLGLLPNTQQTRVADNRSGNQKNNFNPLGGLGGLGW